MVELGTHPATKRADVVTLHLSARAPAFYPDICMSGSVGWQLGDVRPGCCLPDPTGVDGEVPAVGAAAADVFGAARGARRW
jgi:hypothetical protein